METLTQLVSMKGRRVLITGASSGIGRAMAIRFADAGADLILVDVNGEGLFRTKEDVRSFPCSVTTRVVDLSIKKEIDALWSRLEEEPDTLINNAGIYPMRDYLEVDQSFLCEVLKVNLESAFWMCQNFIGRRKARGGVIINVSSIEAILPFKEDLIPYAISKSGLLALTRSLARDYGRKGFRVNAVLPGAIRTPGTENLIRSAVKRFNLSLAKAGYNFQSRLALGRWGKPDEVACVALFLASGLASYVQGAIIPVDGGFLSG